MVSFYSLAPLYDGAVTTAKIAALAVTTAKLAADAVTYAKIQNVSAISKVLGRGSAAGAGDVEEITIGANLTMTGTTLSGSAGGTGWVVLSDVTTGANASSYTVSSISSTYKILRLICFATNTTAANALTLTLNADSGANYQATAQMRPAGATYGGAWVGAASGIGMAAFDTTAQMMIIDIIKPTDTSRATVIMHGTLVSQTQQYMSFGEWANVTDAVSAITLTVGANNIASGSRFILIGQAVA